MIDELIKEYIRKVEYRCEHLQETADSMEETFLLSTTPLRLEEGSFLSKISFIGQRYSGFGLLKFSSNPSSCYVLDLSCGPMSNSSYIRYLTL